MPTPPCPALLSHPRHQHTHQPTAKACSCKPWRRLYLDAEHTRSKLLCKWESNLNDLASKFDKAKPEYEETISMLKEELLHTRVIQAAQRKIIQQLQSTLLNNGLPVTNSMA